MIQFVQNGPTPGSGAPAGPENPLTVSTLVHGSRRTLERTFRDIWVAGELIEWTRWRNGNCYATLGDGTANLRVVMFRDDAARLLVQPEAGWAVLMRGRVTVYEDRGTLQLKAREIRLQDERGLRQIAIERLREQLRAEGLLDTERKRPLPVYPAKIGIVTSPQGAALQDVLTVLGRRWPCAEVVVYPVRVQGRSAEIEVAEMIRAVGSTAVDVLIVARGGGSAEDLWAFNSERVARAIAGCRIPVISAIGHETDITVADLVADLRAPTPSAAAELVAPDLATVRAGLYRLATERASRMDGILGASHTALAEERERLQRGPLTALHLDGERLAGFRPTRLAAVVTARLDAAGHQVDVGHPDNLLPSVQRALDRSTARLAEIELPALRRGMNQLIHTETRELVTFAPRVLGRFASNIADRTDARLQGLAAELHALSPEAAMRRGYGILVSASGRVLCSAADVAVGDDLWIRMADGLVQARATTIKRVEDNDA